MAQITLRDYLQETEDAISSQRVDEALAHCQYMLTYFPESLEAQRLLGEVYLAQGRFEEARQAFDWILINDPENVVVYCSRALVSEKIADYDTALDCYQQAYELSRGNSQIRLAFNQLSMKTGQQGFMLSRAGLARLYMRGDLLSQAIQEWDVVLASTPDRVDARLGLLETYWREGLYDRVPNLANQILQDVPACEKALLLLAHVTAPQDMLQARELVKRAQTLDPDLVLAQDLFSDLLANHAGDPFLKLLKVEPAILAGRGADQGAASKSDAGSARGGALADWDSEQAGSETTLVKPKPPQEEAKASSSWQSGTWGNMSGDFALNQASAGESLELQNGNGNYAGAGFSQRTGGNSLWDVLDQNSQTDISGSAEPEPWSLLQDALTKLPPEVAQGQLQPSSLLPSEFPSSADNALAAPSSASSFQQENNPAFPSYAGFDQWGSSSGESSTPAWLSMLTQQAEQEQEAVAEAYSPPSEPPVAPAAPPIEEKIDLPPVEVPPVSVPQPDPQPEVVNEPPAAEEPEMPMFAFNDDDGDQEEESLFSPDWLKSIGAEVLEDGTGEVPVVKVAAQAEPVASVMPPVQPTPDQQTKSDKLAAIPTPEPIIAKIPTSLPDVQSEPVSTGRSWLDELSIGSSAPPLRQDNPVVPTHEEFVAGVQPVASDMWGRSVNIPEPETQYTAAGNEEYQQQASDPFEYNNGWSGANGQPSWLEQMTAGITSEPLTSTPAFGTDTERDEVEQSVVSTLEELEKNLLSSGFVPLEPNSLADLAKKSAEEPAPSYSFGLESMQEQTYAPSSDPFQQPSFSSSFAELSGSVPFNEPFHTAQPEPGFAAASAYAPIESAPQGGSHELDLPRDTRLGEQEVVTTQQSEPAWLAALRATPSQPGFPVSPQSTGDQPQLMAQGTGSMPVIPQPIVQQPQPMRQATGPMPAMPQPIVQQPQPMRQATGPMPVIPQPMLNQAQAMMQSTGKTPAMPRPQVNQPQAMTQSTGKMPVMPRPQVNQPPAKAQNTGAIPVNRRQPFESTSSAQPRMPIEASPSSMNPLLGSELETTMKRPAVRLQPVQQQRINVPREQPGSSPSRPNIQEVSPFVPPMAATGRSNNKVADDQLSHQDRLVKGYQSQLIGDYDTAMQEYRIIIRNAPELLGEVVSNMRALLKLAPKYSAGYRVLGDAYMRQGEYLQAMEAYNKALTMAKKAKS